MAESKYAMFVMPSSLIGGAERVAFNLVMYLLSQNWRVSLVTMSRGRSPGWEQLENNPNFDWIALNARSEKFGVLPAIAAVIRLSRRHRLSLVYSTHAHVNAMLSSLRRARLLTTRMLVVRESTVIFMRKETYPHFLFRILYGFYGRIDALICQTPLMKDHLLKAVPRLSRFPVVVVPNPVNIDYISQRVAEGDTEANVELIDFVFCGRLIPLKRPDLVIRALALLDRETWRTAHFLGRGDNGELRTLAANLGIADRIIFRGSLDNPYAVFARSKVGILASTIEGFPNVLLEMMASGTGRIVSSLCTPAVTDLPGIDIVDPINAEQLAAALTTALAGPKRTDEFRDYIAKERSVLSFWKRIELITNKFG